MDYKEVVSRLVTSFDYIDIDKDGEEYCVFCETTKKHVEKNVLDLVKSFYGVELVSVTRFEESMTFLFKKPLKKDPEPIHKNDKSSLFKEIEVDWV